HQLVGAGIVEQALLRKDADLDVDRPFVFVDQWPHAFEAAQPDAGIDLELGAHVGRAVEDAFLERALGALVDVLRRERLLGLRDFPDRFLEVALVDLAALEDGGLVEMNMRLDQSRADQPALQVDRLGVGREPRPDFGDPAAGDSDVGCLPLGAGEPRVAQYQIHRVPRFSRWLRRWRGTSSVARRFYAGGRVRTWASTSTIWATCWWCTASTSPAPLSWRSSAGGRPRWRSAPRAGRCWHRRRSIPRSPTFSRVSPATPSCWSRSSSSCS